MGIISGSLQTLKGITFGRSLLNSGGGRGYFCPFAVAYQVNSAPGWSRISSVPSGYGWSGYWEALKTGGIAARSAGSTLSTSDLKGIAEIETPTSGTSSSTVPVRAANTFSLSAGGTVASIVDLRGFAYLKPALVIGAQPSPLDIADAVWQRAASSFTSAGTMAAFVKTAAEQSTDSLKLGEYIALE